MATDSWMRDHLVDPAGPAFEIEEKLQRLFHVIRKYLFREECAYYLFVDLA